MYMYLPGAFGGTQMMQDRFCIATGNNASSQLLSVEDVVACMDLFIGTPGQGCGGGAPMNTYYYLSHEGIVSGGDYGDQTGDTCLPYLVPPTLSAVYCSFNGHFFLELAVENAEIMENCP